MAVSTAKPRPRIDPRIEERRVAVRRQRGRKRLRLLLALLVLSGLLAAFGALHSSLLSARQVTVHGTLHTPQAQILAVSGLVHHPPLIDVDPGRISARLERLPWVREAVVDKAWPDSVTITVSERKPVATVAREGQVALVDATGRVLAYERRAPPATVGLVLAGSGVAPPGAPGSRLGSLARPALRVAAELPVSLAAQVTAVSLSGSGAISLELSGGMIALLGSDTELGEKFEDLASVLGAVPLSAGDQIDLTVPSEPTVSARPA
jgi:cell division protein FtsQ